MVLAALAGGCGGCFDTGEDPQLTFFQNADFYVEHRRVWEPLPEGDGSSGAKALPPDAAAVPWEVRPDEDFSISVPFSGGPVDQVRVEFGERHFEFPIDLSLDPDAMFLSENEREREAAGLSAAARESSGTLSLTGTLSEWVNLPDAKRASYRYQVRGTDGSLSPPQEGGSIILCTQEGDCTPDATSGGGAGGGGGGGNTALAWKETWLFVQSDKAVQWRMALARKEGIRHYVKLQYRVSAADACTSCGYHLYERANGTNYQVYFPAGYAKEYTLPLELWIDLDGTEMMWDEASSRPVYASGSGIDFPWSCVDDDSVTPNRCATFLPADQPSQSFTAQ